MELGETIGPIMIPEQFADQECPFSHEKPNPDETNRLGGIGTKLGDNMADGVGVHTSAPPGGPDYTKGEKEQDPRMRPKPNKIACVFIKVNGKTVILEGKKAAKKNKPLPYPLTCAAHHLIPAQESLKEVKRILQFMCKDGEQQDFRNSGAAAPATVPESKVWGNVAYNVNGCQNGVWLPGNYAVGAGKAAVEVWKNRMSDKRKTYTDEEAAENWERAVGADEWASLSKDPKEQEEPQPGALQKALLSSSQERFMLAGKNYDIHEGNPKWAYVKAAMDAANGQFHDRHESYSKEVKKYLKKIAEIYEQMYDQAVDDENPCEKCKEARKPANAKDDLVGPPYGIVSRLVAASNFFKGFLMAKIITVDNIYTSKWVETWIKK